MSGMNWDRVNRENRAIREANRVFEPEPTRPVRRTRRSPKKRRRMTEKERALAWHRQKRTAASNSTTTTTQLSPTKTPR